MTVTADPRMPDPASCAPNASGTTDPASSAPTVSGGDDSLQGPAVVFTGEPHSPVASDAFAEPSSSDVLSVVEQMEALKTWADYVSLAATSELSRREERIALEEAGPDATATVRTGARVAAHSATADEIVLATGIGYRDALARVLFSLADPTRVQGLRDRLRTGQLPWHRARILHEDCADLTPDLAADIADAVLAPTPGGAALSGSLFRQRLTRHLARHQPATTQRAHALAARALSVTLNPDGTGTLTLTGAAARLRGAHQRIDTIARRLRAAGSQRTLAQLRSDIALDLILFGTLPSTAEAESPVPTSEPASTTGTNATATHSEPSAPTATAGNATRPDPAGPFRATATRTAADADADADDVSPAAKARSPFDPAAAPETRPGAAAESAEVPAPNDRAEHPATAPPGTTSDLATEKPHLPDVRPRPPTEAPPPHVDMPGWDPESIDCSIDPALFGQQLPPAHVTVTVALSTLLGLDHEPGLLGGADGHDYLDADTIRATAMTAGSTWRRLITDPLTGHAHELSTTTYRPGQPLTRAVWARDLHCRVPGCTTPATRSDLDHDIDYDHGGTTSLDNLSAKHRRHHNHKTTHRWHTHRDGDTITWTTGTGRTYTSHPADHRPLVREPSHSLLEIELTRITEHVLYDPTDRHPISGGPDVSLDEKPPPPAPPEPRDPGPPPF